MASATQPTKNATRARLRPTAGRNFGSRGPGRAGGGSSGASRPNRPGRSFSSPSRSIAGHDAQPLQHPHGAKHVPQAVGVREQVQEDPAAEEVPAFFHAGVFGFDRLAERFDQPAVLHAGRTDRFARPAVEAQFEVPLHAVGQLGAAVGDQADELDPAAGTVVLVARLQVRGARRRAQPAMDAAEQLVVGDARGQVVVSRLVRVVWAIGVHENESGSIRVYLLVIGGTRITLPTLHPKVPPGFKTPAGSNRCWMERINARRARRPPDFGRREFGIGGRCEHGQVSAGRGGKRSQRILY